MSRESAAERIDRRAETLKLARLLGCEAEELGYLAGVAAADLRLLRDQATEVLYGGQGAALGRLAAASRLLPVALVAQLAERAFGPVLSARLAGLIEPERAVELAARLPIGFLASLAIELDPRRARDVIARIPPDQIARISSELTRRREYVTMGRFVGALPDASIRAAMGAMDPPTMLEVALVLEDKQRLGDVFALIGPEATDGIIAAAVDAGLAEEALALLDQLDDGQRARLLARPELQAYRRAS
jgi:hypothetical protein